MIVNDHRSVSIAAASAFALGISLLTPGIARAADGSAATAAASVPAPVASSAAYAPDTATAGAIDAAQPAASLSSSAIGGHAAPMSSGAIGGHAAPMSDVDVNLNCDGRQIVVSTKAETVGQFLMDRDIRVAEDDFVSAPLDSELAPGMQLSYRSSKILTIIDGARKRIVHSAAATVGDVLHELHIAVASRDDVSPSMSEAPLPDDVIRISHGSVWTVRDRTPIAPKLRERDDAQLALGNARIVDPGRSGVLETTTRVSRRADGTTVRKVLGSRIVRAPRARIIERGIAQYSSLASVAARGFQSALRFAGSALHVIATAYTAGCYGCSGITASGQRAGFGIIAVDPSVIPLGTKLFIPGYGRAVAGDTGGAIRGHRVDLGMNSLAEAMQFGRRQITVYVLR